MWFAGLLLATPWISWTVIACSIPRRDPVRAVRFYDACEVLGARGIVLPFVEIDVRELAGLEHLDFAPYDLVATHNYVGEYGNPHHIVVASHVLNRAVSASVLVPGYGLDRPGVIDLPLSESDWQTKLAAIRCYDHTTEIDRQPKSEALLARYGSKFDLRRETYHALRWRLPAARADGGQAGGGSASG
jgi:hypothetical protein